MDISGYLAELIKTKTKVVVPGFGTFLKEEKPASYDNAADAFIPPSETIIFKHEYDSDTTLLNYISQKENIDIDSVAFLVEQYANNLNDILASTEFIKIDVLGTFEKNNQGYAFNPDPHLLSNNYFGLNTQKDIVAHSHQAPKFEEESYTENHLEEELEEEAPRSYKKIILLILILLLAELIYIQVNQPDFFNSTWNALVNSEPASAPVSTTPQQNPAPTDTTTHTTAGIHADSSAVEPDIKNEQESYEIVVAAFGKRSEADEFIQRMAAQNIQAHALPNKPKEFIKISVGSFSDAQSAQTELKRIQAELSKSAWIYHLKPIKNQENVSTTN